MESRPLEWEPLPTGDKNIVDKQAHSIVSNRLALESQIHHICNMTKQSDQFEILVEDIDLPAIISPLDYEDAIEAEIN